MRHPRPEGIRNPRTKDEWLVDVRVQDSIEKKKKKKELQNRTSSENKYERPTLDTSAEKTSQNKFRRRWTVAESMFHRVLSLSIYITKNGFSFLSCAQVTHASLSINEEKEGEKKISKTAWGKRKTNSHSEPILLRSSLHTTLFTSQPTNPHIIMLITILTALSLEYFLPASVW